MSQYPELYGTRRWRRLRAQQLKSEPLCWYCLQIGKVTASDTVDHIKPHRGNVLLFYDPSNLRSSCKPCHDSVAAKKDVNGWVPGFGVDGFPVDGGHRFNGK